jgi:hypothetical protein
MSNNKTPGASRSPATSTITTRTNRCHRDPLDSIHPCAKLRPCGMTRGAPATPCYRAMRLLHEHFGQDPATLRKDQFQDCILHAKPTMADAVS